MVVGNFLMTKTCKIDSPFLSERCPSWDSNLCRPICSRSVYWRNHLSLHACN